MTSCLQSLIEGQLCYLFRCPFAQGKEVSLIQIRRALEIEDRAGQQQTHSMHKYV